MARTYIGDDIYAEYEDGELTLTVENVRGRVTDAIALDVSVLMLLIQYLRENASPGVLALLQRVLVRE
jgi:hypothetical protein